MGPLGGVGPGPGALPGTGSGDGHHLQRISLFTGVAAEVAVATWIVAWDGKLTMARRFQVIRVADGVTLLRAAMRFACVELSSGRPRRLPQAFIDGYGPAVLAATPCA